MDLLLRPEFPARCRPEIWLPTFLDTRCSTCFSSANLWRWFLRFQSLVPEFPIVLPRRSSHPSLTSPWPLPSRFAVRSQFSLLSHETHQLLLRPELLLSTSVSDCSGLLTDGGHCSISNHSFQSVTLQLHSPSSCRKERREGGREKGGVEGGTRGRRGGRGEGRRREEGAGRTGGGRGQEAEKGGEGAVC